MNTRHDTKITLKFPPVGPASCCAWALKDGTAVKIRPVSVADAEMWQRFIQDLPDRNRYARDFVPGTNPGETTTTVPGAEIAAIAAFRRDRRGEEVIVGIARLTIALSPEEAEFVVAVSSRCRNLGLGTRLLSCLLEFASVQQRLRLIRGDVSPENDAMQHVCLKLGFTLFYNAETGTVQPKLGLLAPPGLHEPKAAALVGAAGRY
jgi:acetyltransferase